MKKLSFNKQLHIAGNIVTFFYLCCILLFFCWVFSGCDKTEYKRKMAENFIIIQVDSCEYVFKHTYDGFLFSHKGNCKFCAERLKHNNSLTLD